VAPPGQWNAISRVVLHLTAPGTPDLYRGDELWFLALVDPDNRRAADSQEHSRLLNDLAALEVQPDHGNIAVLAPKPARAPSRPRPNGTRWARRSAAPVDATLKLAVLQRLLHTRRAHAALFRCGDYAALEVAGDRAKHLVAFLRAYGEERVVVLAPRLLDSMGLQTPSELDWGNTRVVLPSGLAARHFRCALTDQAMVVPTVSPSFSASAVLRSLPTAVLMSS
jgi:(1->4)-alpha-D-glucan 1-alpha-D-glucosylmutase